MIPFDLKNLLQNSILLILILVSNKLFAQQDTVVVYEYIYKTDTVWLKQEPTRDTTDLRQLQNVDDATLIIDTTNNKTELVIFSSGQSATIPINRILLDENHLKQITMKKVSFFPLFFLAIQSIAYAQPEISIKAGVSQFWNYPFSNLGNHSCFGDHEGFELKGSTSLKNLSFAVGYEHHGFGMSFPLLLTNSEDNTTTEQNYKIIQTHRSVPVLLYYRINRFELFAGYEYRFVRIDASYFSINEYNTSISYRNEHAISTGIEYSINKKLSVYSKLYLGNTFIKRNAGTYNSVNGTSLDISLKYYLNKNPNSQNGK
jgi:predicted porin